nr:46 kDa FK506-binding nuclear protein isoform X2 [Maniola hyperantus]
MFWGLIMEPNKRYTQVVEKPFHISQAAMDISTGDNDACQVMVVVDGKNFLVCTLQKNKCIQVPLDLYFKTGDSISFLTNGKCNVHLTGYLDPEFEEEPSDEEEGEEEEDEEEEAPTLVPTKNKRKLDNAVEGNVNKKAKHDKKATKKEVAADSSDSDEDGVDPLQKFLDGEDIDTDENDDTFNVNSSADADSDSDEEESVDEEAGEEGDEDEEEEDDSDKANTTLETSTEEKVSETKLSKSQKRRLKKRLQKEKQEQKEPQVNGVEKAKKEKPAEQQKAKKEKGDAKKEKGDAKKEKGDATKDTQEKKEKKSLSGGVFIEDLKVGTGPVAKPGKVVMVYYEGKLKQNNKMFDNCQKGPGFKFKLGAKEVISGWDVGVAGMKVGGKRRILCPPAMAYGAKGSPPVIPPNSTLVFEVELKNVK